jgi:hypothetical protein
MADSPSRQARQQEYLPEQSPRRLLSDEAMQYVNLAAKLQREAVTDPALNGADALARLRGPHGG